MPRRSSGRKVSLYCDFPNLVGIQYRKEEETGRLSCPTNNDNDARVSQCSPTFRV